MFFVFDGVDGAGKSTQLAMLAEWLTERGHQVRTCTDPGSTKLGDRIRELLLGNHDIALGSRAETLLFVTARAQLVAEIIVPALKAGEVVICDRFTMSTVVYQGLAEDVDESEIHLMNDFATGGIRPDMTFVFDLPTESAVERLGQSLDRMESRGPEYLERVRQGFAAAAATMNGPVSVIDATKSIDDIQQELREIAAGLLPLAGEPGVHS